MQQVPQHAEFPRYTAAGFVLMRITERDTFEVLGLLQEGGYDLPKGRLEPDESILQGAVRETYEETCIDSIGMPWGKQFCVIKTLALFLGLTNQTPKIRPNPVSGELEHLKTRWMSFEDAKLRFHDFLIPAIAWAEMVVEGDRTTRGGISDVDLSI